MFVSQNKSKNRSFGFTTFELVIAAGWSTVILLASYTTVSALISRSTYSQNVIKNNEFVSAISQELASPSKCNTQLGPNPILGQSGKILPPLGSKVPLTISNYSGFGSGGKLHSGASLPDGTIVATTTDPYILPNSSNNIRILEMTLERRGGPGIISDTNNLVRDIAVIRIQSEIRNPQNGNWDTLPQRVIEVPVIIDKNSGEIKSCLSNSSIALFGAFNCNSTGGQTIVGSGSCATARNDFRGFYITQTQEGTSSTSCRIPNPLSNQSINGGCNCPVSNLSTSTSTYPYHSGLNRRPYTYLTPQPCGKKGTCMVPVTIYYLDRYYLCVDNIGNF